MNRPAYPSIHGGAIASAVLMAALVLPASAGDGILSLAPEASGIIDERGGVIEVVNAASPLYGSRVVIPAGALSAPTEVSINQVIQGSPYPGDVLVTDIEPREVVLARPASITLRYSLQYLYDTGASVTDLQVLRMDGPRAGREFEMRTRDTDRGLLTVQTMRLGALVPLTASNATVNGDYGIVSFRFNRAAPQGSMPAKGAALPRPRGFESSAGIITFDGTGNFSISGTRNIDGTGGAFSGSGTYSISSAGAVSVPVSKLSGQVQSNGNISVLATKTGSPELDLMVKSTGSYSEASVNGTYTITSFRYDLGASQPKAPAKGTALPRPKGFSTLVETMKFDGAGNFTVSGTENEDGTSHSRSGSGTYTVSPTGVVTVAAENLTGQLLSGNVIVLASTSDDPEIHMLVKKTGSFSNASVKGTYTLAGFRFDLAGTQGSAPAKGSELPLPGGISTLLQTFTFNGKGSYTFTGYENYNGRATSRSGSGTYSVTSSGIASVPAAGLTGQVVSGGVVVLATKSGNPEFVVLIKH